MAKADEKAALLLEGYKEQAIRALDGLADPTLKGLLRRVLARIFTPLHFEGYCREQEAAARAALGDTGPSAGQLHAASLDAVPSSAESAPSTRP